MTSKVRPVVLAERTFGNVSTGTHAFAEEEVQRELVRRFHAYLHGLFGARASVETPERFNEYARVRVVFHSGSIPSATEQARVRALFPSSRSQWRAEEPHVQLYRLHYRRRGAGAVRMGADLLLLLCFLATILACLYILQLLDPRRYGSFLLSLVSSSSSYLLRR